MKIAFIAHAVSIGGGSLSSSKVIQYLIDQGSLHPEDCLIIHDKTAQPSDEKNDVYFGLKKTIKFYETPLPFSYVYKGGPTNPVSAFRQGVKNLFTLFSFLIFYRKFLVREKISIIHLNSIVLWPLLLIIPKNVSTIIHIREIVVDSISAKIAVFVINRKASRILSIDPISNIPFSKNNKSAVIVNPFDMSEARQLRKQKDLLKDTWKIPEKSFVISLIGRIEEGKGFDFFLQLVKLFSQTNSVVFLVIGLPQSSYGQKCVEGFQILHNVRYLGEQYDLSEIYAMTDIVIRCEDYLPLGRTVWEGLFAGCLCLIPVNEKDDLSIINDIAGKYLFTYRAGSVSDCNHVLESILTKYPETISDTGYPRCDNMKESSEGFFQIISELSRYPLQN